MKVVCDACQAKYQIPDERVAGRKLKIRCRKCGNAIVGYVRREDIESRGVPEEAFVTMPGDDRELAALLRQRIQERIGRRVIALPGAAQHRRH